MNEHKYNSRRSLQFVVKQEFTIMLAKTFAKMAAAQLSNF